MAGEIQNPDPAPPMHDDNDFDKVPIPPENKQAPDFLDAAVSDFEPKQWAVPEPQRSAAAAPPIQSIDLPDFTDEDLAALDAPLPPLPSLPAVKLVHEESIVPAPANAIELPDDDIKLPTGEVVEPERLEAAKFISSTTYFTIIADIKGTRRSMRQSDESIKEAILRHEQLDQQYKRVATDMNAVQEHLIKIDGALFE